MVRGERGLTLQDKHEHEIAFGQAVNMLIGLKCWGAVGGVGTAFALDFGQKFLRDRPIPNKHLSHVVRENEPEFSLYVHGTPWRIQTETEVIAGWLDEGDSVDDDPSQAALDRLLGSRVVRADLTAPAHDLVLTFDNGLTLSVFPDGSPHSDHDDYVLFTRHCWYAVGWGGLISVERRLLDVDLRDAP